MKERLTIAIAQKKSCRRKEKNSWQKVRPLFTADIAATSLLNLEL